MNIYTVLFWHFYRDYRGMYMKYLSLCIFLKVGKNSVIIRRGVWSLFSKYPPSFLGSLISVETLIPQFCRQSQLHTKRIWLGNFIITLAKRKLLQSTMVRQSGKILKIKLTETVNGLSRIILVTSVWNHWSPF